MKKYWFKPKRYGYGFYPISWEGWVFTLVLLGAIFASAYINNFFTDSVSIKQGLRYLLDIAFIMGLFSILAKGKTKGELKWQWGRKKAK